VNHDTATVERAMDASMELAVRYLASVLLENRSLAQLATDIACLAARTIPHVDEVSIALVDGAGTNVFVFSGDLAATLDERQYNSGFGPALDAAQPGSLLRIDDTDTAGEYPDFNAAAQRQGISRVAALALPMSTEVRGAMTLYCRRRLEAITSHDLVSAVTFASYASAVLINAARLHRLERHIAGIEAAMQSRSVIEQAKGILMARLAYDADTAFQQLVHRSQEDNRKLRDVATELAAATAKEGPAIALARSWPILT